MNVLLTTLFAGYSYPFHQTRHAPFNYSYMEEWHKSVMARNLRAIIFVDEAVPLFVTKSATENIKVVQVDTKRHLNPIDIRWRVIHNYLSEHKEIEYAFASDISDSTVLRNPFPMMEKGKIYIGKDEDGKTMMMNWMRTRWDMLKTRFADDKSIDLFLQTHAAKQCFNCGVFGADRETFAEVAGKAASFLDRYNVSEITVDMNAVNYVLYSDYEDRVVHGYPVTTEFRKHDKSNMKCWFQHK